jgi:hypothetical protein
MTDPGLQAAAAAAPAGDRPHYTDEHTVFVKGLGFDVQEEDLRRLFAELGVKSVRMGRDRVTGQSRVSARTDGLIWGEAVRVRCFAPMRLWAEGVDETRRVSAARLCLCTSCVLAGHLLFH